MLNQFYAAFAPLSFTVYGLWLIVVQTRHADWRRSPAHRRRAYAVSLHFALPGLMSLLALVDPTNTTVWRISFALSGAAGAISVGNGTVYTIHLVSQTWDETATALEPAIDGTLLTKFDAVTVVGKKFAEVDVTPTVQGWRADSTTSPTYAPRSTRSATRRAPPKH